MSFRTIRKWSEPRQTFMGAQVPGLCCEYEAEFSDAGKRAVRRINDSVAYRPNGTPFGMVNTSPSVSYYSQLKKAMGLK